MPDSDPSALVIAFGKHRGLTVAELLAKDPSYAQWLLGQAWLADRFAKLHAALASRGAAADETPEHNLIQARFTNPTFRHVFLETACPDLLAESRFNGHEDFRRRHIPEFEQAEYALTVAHYPHNCNPASIQRAENALAKLRNQFNTPLPDLTSIARFEQHGVDVVLIWTFSGRTIDPSSSLYRWRIHIEIKPSLGDDYPTVMRQIQRLSTTYLLIDSYAGRTIPFTQLREMFKANGVRLVTLREVEDQMPPEFPKIPT